MKFATTLALALDFRWSSSRRPRRCDRDQPYYNIVTAQDLIANERVRDA